MRALLSMLSMLSVGLHADDLWVLSDEFDNAATLANWQDLGVLEGWETPSFELADIDATEPGRFHVVPGPLTWFANFRGLLLFKEVTGDFVVTTRVRVLSRHNPGDPTEVPNRSFSLTGIFAHAPRAISQAAPDPYTVTPVWPPGDFGSDYVPNTENYIFLSYGSAGNPGTRQFEIKATRNSDSRLYYNSTGIDQSETEAWLQMVRVGDTVVCLRKHAEAGPWYVENRYPNPDHPFPEFGETLQVGITAYTDWETANPYLGTIQSQYHFNYAPPGTGMPDLISQADYYRFRRPDPLLTEAVLQGMSVSYDPATNLTADPPVLLSASAAAAPYLGDQANLAYDPFGEWQVAEFGPDADQPFAGPEVDVEGDGLANLLEFILGGDADESSVELLPSAQWLADEIVFSFVPAIDHGARLEVEFSETLGLWQTVASRPLRGGAWEVAMPGASVQLVDDEVRVTIPSASASGFVRLEGDLMEP
ncbi:hypothetical protein HAHE_42800 [Haloferula helveola]|uniref:Uncharacterized protein n=1 Tax=Haloferula helveola TaxID=490095 RepID=A0ABM7RS88_9BACT|nr:hypothetical protein HAHE_42800 [Haloferula helveola]